MTMIQLLTKTRAKNVKTRQRERERVRVRERQKRMAGQLERKRWTKQLNVVGGRAKR